MEFFQSVWIVGRPEVSTFLISHGGAELSHTDLERSDRYGSEVGQKKWQKMLIQDRVARSTGGVTWRHRGVFPICLDR